MGYISKCKHGTPMALCRKCFPDVSEHNDWSNYKYTHPVKEEAEQQSYQEQDGCPTELAVLQRFWRKAQKK